MGDWYGYALAVAAAALWGLTYCLDERLLGSLSVPKLYLLHAVSGAVVVATTLWWRGESLRELVRFDGVAQQPLTVAATMLVSTLASLAIFSSIRVLGASRAALLEISYPLFVVAFGFVLFQHRPQWPVLAGGLLILLGSAIIVRFG